MSDSQNFRESMKILANGKKPDSVAKYGTTREKGNRGINRGLYKTAASVLGIGAEPKVPGHDEPEL